MCSSRKSGDPRYPKMDTGVSTEATQGTVGIVHMLTPTGKSGPVVALLFMEWQEFHRFCFNSEDLLTFIHPLNVFLIQQIKIFHVPSIA